jgi:hypothetical protein
MGISPDEMNALVESQEEEWYKVDVRKIKPRTGERREKERRKPAELRQDFLGMERRVDLDRRTSNGKSRIKHDLEYKSL